MKFMELQKRKWIACLVLLSACGQDVSRSPITLTPVDSPITAEPGSGSEPPSPFGDRIGKSAFSVGVNRAVVGISSDETENQFAVLRTLEGVNSPGAYYGVGLGNQAQLGFGLNLSGVKTQALESVSFKVREASSPHEDCESHVRLSLLVDLNCDSLNPDYRVVTTDMLIPAKKNEWVTFEVKATDASFRFARSTSNKKSLQSLLKSSPLACFVAGDVFDLGMKRGQKLAPLQLIYGDRFYFEPTSLELDDLEYKFSGERHLEDFDS